MSIDRAGRAALRSDRSGAGRGAEARHGMIAGGARQTALELRCRVLDGALVRRACKASAI